MKPPAVILVLLGVLGCASTPAPLAPAGPESLADVFSAGGLFARVLDGTSLILARDDRTERNVVVFVEDAGASLQAVLACPWRRALVDPARIAAWNAGRRFGRAYLDDEGRPVLAADLALDPTVSRQTVIDWGRLVLDLADAFVAEVWPAR
jgi:hypothetical protein